MAMNHLVSIIMPTLNSALSINFSLQSLSNQTYENIELVIVDGGSNDETLSLVNDSGLRVTIVEQSSKGIWGAINEGILAAKGEYLFSLNSDDIVSPSSIQCLVEFATKGEFDVVWLPTYSAGGYKNRLNSGKRWLGMDRVSPGHSASFLIAKKAQDLMGLYSEKVIFCADHYLFYKIFASGLRVGCMDNSRAAYGVFTQGGYSATNSYLVKAKEEFVFRKCRALNDRYDFLFCYVVYPLKVVWGNIKRVFH